MKTRWIVTLVISLICLFAIWPRHRPSADVPEAGADIAAPLPSGTVRTTETSAPSAIPPNPSDANPPTATASTKGAAANVSLPVQPPAAPPVLPEISAPDLDPPFEQLRGEIDNVQFALRDYRSVLGENPVGTNAEITKALLGDNLKQVKIPVPAGSSVNADGEMCDRWGTPYFFHQLSGKQMEIHSAGPDRKLGTRDDLVVK